MHPHPLQGNLWVITCSTVFKAKHLAEEISVTICTLPIGGTGHRQVQIALMFDDSQIDALMLWYSACSSAFSLSLPPKITLPYLQSPLNPLYLYFICTFTLIQAEHVLFTCSLTKAFANAVKTHWDWGHSSVLCIYCTSWPRAAVSAMQFIVLCSFCLILHNWVIHSINFSKA